MPRGTLPDIDLEPEGPTALAFPSANCNPEGVTLTTTWSDGQNPPAKMMILNLSWEEVVALVEERGDRIDPNLTDMKQAVSSES